MADNRVHAETFFDAGVEVREGGEGGVGRGVGKVGGAEGGDEERVGAGGAEDVVEDCF